MALDELQHRSIIEFRVGGTNYCDGELVYMKVPSYYLETGLKSAPIGLVQKPFITTFDEFGNEVDDIIFIKENT